MLYQSHRVCLAPMLDYTDRHFRYLLRLITKKTFLYSEMVTTGALLYGKNTQRHLQFSAIEQPVALQLGGNDPEHLTKAAVMAQDYGYNEINLNAGCPSPRVKSGQFGASLIEVPELVTRCMLAMQEKLDIPVTIKTRIGIDHNDDYSQLATLVEHLDKAQFKTFIIHARKAWLDGLSPKDNREIPPLRYEYVYQLKRDFPHLNIIINGGIKTLAQTKEHLQHVDGVMIGREAYHNCYFMKDMDALYVSDKSVSTKENKTLNTRKQILAAYMDYAENELYDGVPLGHLVRHTLGLFFACPGARLYRQEISENAHKPGAGTGILEKAASFVDCD
ncbi:MAG: tRNA dihydrouridine(20/20a) synthase DusA [Pseudomonadota bacterium]